MDAAALIERLYRSNARLWLEDGEIRSADRLTDAQRRFLEENKALVIDALCTPHGTKYMWRHKDPHNVAGWRIHYDRRPPAQVQSMFGPGVELRVLETISGREVA